MGVSTESLVRAVAELSFYLDISPCATLYTFGIFQLEPRNKEEWKTVFKNSIEVAKNTEIKSHSIVCTDWSVVYSLLGVYAGSLCP